MQGLRARSVSKILDRVNLKEQIIVRSLNSNECVLTIKMQSASFPFIRKYLGTKAITPL